MPLLTPVRRGLIYFGLHVLTLVGILALSKGLMQTYGFGEVLFLRNATSWLVVAAFVGIKPTIQPWKTARWKGHLIRGFVGFTNMVLLYLSVKLLPLALALTIRQLEAFIWVALAAYVYREKVSRRQWIALVIGFAGVLLVMRPALELNLLGTCAALACAVTGGIVRVLSRELSRTEDSITIVFFNFTQWTLLSLCVMPWTWTMPTTDDWVPFLLVGAVILISQWLQTEGMRLVPAPRLAPWRNAEIFWAGLLGWVLWQEPVSLWFVTGSVLIVAGGIAANWHQKNPRKAAHLVPLLP